MRFGTSMVMASVVASFCATAMAQQSQPKVHVYVDKGIAASDHMLSSTNESDKAAIIDAAAKVPLVEGCIRAASALNQLYVARSIPAFKKALIEGSCKTALTSEERIYLAEQASKTSDDSIEAYLGGDSSTICNVYTHLQYLDSSASGAINGMYQASSLGIFYTGEISKVPTVEASLKLLNDEILTLAAKTDDSCKAIAAARKRQKDIDALGDVIGE